MSVRTSSCLHLLVAAASFAAATDYGYWNVTYTGGASATGYRYHDITAFYSGYSPDRRATCRWLYSPEFRNETLTCNDPSFSYELVDSQRRLTYVMTDITLQQTVEIVVVGKLQNVTLGGTAPITLKYNLGANGRGFGGETVVQAQKCCKGRMNG
ncbi:hypothetical protein QBC38DRAFT_374622 [Podospora fimiseda]|uniref:AA1-like domain-containing protein n=1 Tax=Podospora fimiseda TaxID=252190 RepID=A0AAN7BED2_9PEZI|nr:hypothetical protein QBC38DRAFT_374622 [Podospora fimiseda]